MAISVWIRDRPQREFLGPLPPEVECHLIPREGPLPSEVCDAEFLVPPFNTRPMLELLRKMPALRVVQAISAGFEWLLPWVPDGVTVCNARGTRDNTVAEWVLAVIMAMEKRLFEFARNQTEHDWSPILPGELTSKKALIVGYGSIGHLVATRLSALGMQVVSVASRRRPDVHPVQELPGLLPAADIVVVLVPLTEQTHRLFDKRMLSQLRPGALLVNASRGGVIDTEALTTYLADGRLRAALDVTDPEPLPPDHPLWDAPGVLITPHVAGDSCGAEERVYRLIGEQIRRYANGKPLLNVVKPAHAG
jgi:phosphoglycerate dehydrogenase-like enzyme